MRPVWERDARLDKILATTGATIETYEDETIGVQIGTQWVECFPSTIPGGYSKQTDDDDLVVLISSAHEISKLGLVDTQVTDAGLEHLKHLMNLDFLSLKGTQITDRGAQQLRTLTNLRRLDLSDTDITEAGIASLKDALPNCRIDK